MESPTLSPQVSLPALVSCQPHLGLQLWGRSVLISVVLAETTHSQLLGQQLPVGEISEQLRGDPGLRGNIL